jgi:hypothetical protein
MAAPRRNPLPAESTYPHIAGEERSDCAILLTTARPKGLVVFADPADKRPTCAIVAECELEDWQYEEPPYGEKLRIGFKMIAGEPVRL